MIHTIFLFFISLIVRNRIYNLSKETLLKLETRQNYMTIPASIRELEKSKMVRRSNRQYSLNRAISKRHKTILYAFIMDDEDLRTPATHISNMMTNNQALLNNAEDHDTYSEESFNNFD